MRPTPTPSRATPTWPTTSRSPRAAPKQILKAYERAAEFWEKRITLQPDSAEAWLALGVNQWSRSFRFQFLTSQARMKQAQDALKSIQKAIDLDPNYPEPYAWIGPLLQGRSGQAQAGEGDPLMPRATATSGRSRSPEEGRPSARSCEEELKKSPRSPAETPTRTG